MTQVKGYITKNYTNDFLPLTAGKNHLFAKYDFKIPSEDTKINIKVSCNSDKYLIDYMRLKIVDKQSDINQSTKHKTFNILNLQNM